MTRISVAIAVLVTWFSISYLAVEHRNLAMQVARLDKSLVHAVPMKHAKHGWDVLTQDQVIALGEALKIRNPGKVTLYCASVNCVELRTDFDDAFQIADWPTEFEDSPVDSEGDVGLFVGPPGRAATDLARAIYNATGLQAGIVQIDSTSAGLGVIFGKKP